MSQDQQFLSEILNDEPIPIGKLAYFRERFRDRLYEMVVGEFLKRESSGEISRAGLARRIGKRPEQITRWLGAPGNWTLETVSDLVLAIAKAEPLVDVSPLGQRPARNYSGDYADPEPAPARSALDSSGTIGRRQASILDIQPSDQVQRTTSQRRALAHATVDDRKQ